MQYLPEHFKHRAEYERDIFVLCCNFQNGFLSMPCLIVVKFLKSENAQMIDFMQNMTNL